MCREAETDTKALLVAHCQTYPLAQISDLLKLLHQRVFWCGHLVEDEAAALKRLREEAQALPPEEGGPLCEEIGGGVCRLHLRVLGQSSLSLETLGRFFLATAAESPGSAGAFEEKANILIGLCEDGTLPFSSAEAVRALEESRAGGHPAQRHSQPFRAGYAPAYRVVKKVFCDFLPLFCRIDALAKGGRRVRVAIDGKSGAGKSTLAALLGSVYGCNVFSMDDFFLPAGEKTAERLSQPGGNVSYERFAQEVLTPLESGDSFAYRAYCCRTQTMSEPVAVSPNPVSIVEGVYSLHPHLSRFYEVRVFLSVSGEAQRRRLLARSPGLYDRFVREWIPLEETYFDALEIAAQCDFIFCSDADGEYTLKGGHKCGL